MSPKKLWFYPLLFGVLGTFIGLVLRYAYTGSITDFPFTNVLHAHSHVMLLGFIFTALLVLVWSHFTKDIDRVSYKYYIALQVCMAIMIVAFILQGYAFYSILFSTLHLWLSYILLIRLWKRLVGSKPMLQLVKMGIVFHFISSLGPYTLGPLMVMGLNESPWYQQSIFFYLHFQFFGVFFMWLLAVFLNQTSVIISKKYIVSLTISLIFLYAHSLDYSFDHWLINIIGGLGSVSLFVIFISFKNAFKKLERQFRVLYYIILSVALFNIAGSVPYIAQHLITQRFVLIAWLHFLFLGLYLPFIWVFLDTKIKPFIWILYTIVFVLSEVTLVFPNTLSWLFSMSVTWLLFMVYLLLFLIILTVHSGYLFKTDTVRLKSKVNSKR